MNLDIEYSLSLYEELKSIYSSKKVEIILVQNVHDDRVYIKKILKEYTKDVYESLQNIRSIYTPKIYDIFEINDKLIVIEEFINGDTLQTILEEKGKLGEEVVIKYMISLCDVLDIIHNLDPPVIHRDIKPSNIIISNDNVLKLIDFDIARTYKDGENMDTTLLGTKGYASPEQFGFDQTDCRSDIYAMGIMMNVLSVGKHTKEEISTGVLNDIIKKCTSISANERYQNVVELKKDLENKISKKINLSNSEPIQKKLLKKDSTKYDDIKKYNEEKMIRKIPGFRRGNLLFMITSSMWYLFLIIGLFVFKNQSEFFANITVVVMLLALQLLYANFLNIRVKLPIIRSKNKAMKIFGYWLYSIVIFFIGGIILNYFS
ncbi:serine/threonine protein kinase [Romboutsia weinsteinii]|uniref:non-specific serine/threonine protein kinase n=1 Tax=Romboutsia weinsteinii TaxID=2020949 RepID=A0A371J695_9FIRM|nr:serine/threonine-protein kinase [Romboutsia weinsteinii]RDY28213.1 serine/threonine protein kinase [Romboutsia weinsteinii]